MRLWQLMDLSIYNFTLLVLTFGISFGILGPVMHNPKSCTQVLDSPQYYCDDNPEGILLS